MNEQTLVEFLNWFKASTEEQWQNYAPQLEIGLHPAQRWAGTDWQQGTCWQPLTLQQLSAIEQRWGLDFSWDYRLFLQLLGHTDRPQLLVRWTDDEHTEVSEWNAMMNWFAPDQQVAQRLAAPMAGVLADFPALDPSHAPPLIPLFGHRYLLPRPEQPSLCLSVYGSDLIIWGRDLREALLKDLGQFTRAKPKIQWPSYDSLELEDIPFWGRFLC